MAYGFAVELWGEMALFSRPEFKVERVSYDVITPSAARGILESIYWKPAIMYCIDKIHVYNEPEFTNIRRNEVSAKISHNDIKKLMEGSSSAKGYMNTTDVIQQRASMVLKNVRYVVEFHFEMTGKCSENGDECAEKHYNIILRRMRNGQFFHQPYFGCREFPASFRIVEGDVPKSTLQGKRDLGYMLYDMDFSDNENISPMFFKAEMVDGVIDLKDVKIVR